MLKAVRGLPLVDERRTRDERVVRVVDRGDEVRWIDRRAVGGGAEPRARGETKVALVLARLKRILLVARRLLRTRLPGGSISQVGALAECERSVAGCTTARSTI